MLVKLEENLKILDDCEKKIEQMNFPARQIVVWGMGYVDVLYQNAYLFDHTDIRYYVSKTDTLEHNGYEVINPNDIAGKCDSPVILICAQNESVVNSIRSDIEHLDDRIDSVLMTEYFFGKYAQVIRNNMEHLDEYSKQIYLDIICKMIMNDVDASDICVPEHYFAIPRLIFPNANEVYVDLGAYVGDTLEEYIFKKKGSFGRYYAFEPDPQNYAALCTRIERLTKEWNYDANKIVALNIGVGRERQNRCFESRGSVESTFSSSDGGIKSEIIPIDEYFGKNSVSTIKADIEGFELPMLFGAKNVLKRDKPNLCISIYHNAYDMIFVPDFIISLGLQYKLSIRHHSVTLGDTVLYAWV